MRWLTFFAGVLLALGRAPAEEPYQIAWIQQLGTSDYEFTGGVSADRLGNVYISGSTFGFLGAPNAGGEDAFVAKYDAVGDLLWCRQFGTNWGEQSTAVSADGLGNVYISGEAYGPPGAEPAGFDWLTFLAKYDAAGTLLWSRDLRTNGYEVSEGVSADGLGNVYVSGGTTGSLSAPNAGGWDAFVAKYDAVGDLLWSRQLGTSAGDRSYGVSADGLGNVYVTGTTAGSLGGPNAGESDILLAKYDAAGNLVWTRQLGTSGSDWAHGVSADGLGNVYISGNTWDPVRNGSDAFLGKYDAAGTLLWTRHLGLNSDDYTFGVSGDGLGNVYIRCCRGGTFPGAADERGVAKYDAAGNLLWPRQLPEGTVPLPGLLPVSADGLGNVYISGSTDGSLGAPNAGGTDAWVARLSGAPQKVLDYQVHDPLAPSLDRLARWDGTGWVAVRAGELSSGNIHVLVHRWAPGLRAFADAEDGKIWDAVTDEVNYKEDYKKFAEAIALAAPGDLIVAFNWLDESATVRPPTDSLCWTEAWISRAHADEMGDALAGALREAFGHEHTFNGKLHLLGISHGAAVATEAAADLYNRGEEGSIVVDHLTLGDSPEGFKVGWIAGAANNLSFLDDTKLKIGRTDGTTFVDNYYSFLGRRYPNKLLGLGKSDIVNVQLLPDPTWSDLEKHRYPLDWYRGATAFSRSLALGWSPLLGDTYKTLASDYRQNWQAGEFFLEEVDTGEVYPIELRSDLHLATIETQGNVAEIAGGVRLTEGSSAYWHSSFTKEAEDVAVEFTYQFLNTGDGDQLGLWLDGELRFIMTGWLSDTDPRTSVMDISDLTPGYHILSVALHSYGEPNSIVEVRDFTLISVPEPCSLVLLTGAALVVLAHLLRKRRRAYARPAE